MMFQKSKLALLVHAGGTQTNLKAIQEAARQGKLNAEISAIVLDTEDAVPVLKSVSPDYVCLAGWKKIIPEELIREYQNRILNIHPGLIPDTMDGHVLNPDSTQALWNKGMYGNKAIQNFLDQKATYAGSSIHFLTKEFDFGPVLGRTFEKIEAEDTVESLYARLKKKENTLYVDVLAELTNPVRGREGSQRPSASNGIKILIVGAGGGREHALGWKIAESPRAGELYFARGNAGAAELGTNLDIQETETEKLIGFAKENKIDLTLVVSDDPLALGAVDEFKKAGLRVWGPTKKAAQLESSKAFAKNFMKRHGLPTAKFETFSDYEAAKKYLREQSLPIVIKASGLALGKGVVIAKTREEAQEALENCFVKKFFGPAGEEVVIEEFLEGPEISVHAFSDGKSYALFPASQDHKKIGERNTGPNTGGMGTIAPVSVDMARIEKEIIAPTFAALREEGIEYKGVLYPGLILTKDGPKILEFNARFGDPETQTYMRLLETDLLDIVDACIDGTLKDLQIRWKELFACTIVLASAGYPGNYEKGKVINGIEDVEKDKNIIVFHAGTKLATSPKEFPWGKDNRSNQLVTNGGRVLGVSATGDNLRQALDKVYQAISKISFEGMQYRKDIGKYSI